MKIGFIGAGKMASALVEGILKSGQVVPESIRINDRYIAVAKVLSEKTGVAISEDLNELVAGSDVLICCVKPGDAEAALEPVRKSGKALLVISILAGVPLERLANWSGPSARVIRVMPNTPALIHQGAAAYSAGAGVTAEDEKIVEDIFSAVGKIFRVSEGLLDGVTGLSGSGPAYVYIAIEALADGGVLAGLPRDLALKLAAQTVAGAAGMVLETGLHPGQLKDQVTSPGGTTIAGIEALEESGFRSALIAAVRAATERSRELSK